MHLAGRILATVYFQVVLFIVSAIGCVVLVAVRGLLKFLEPEIRPEIQDRISSLVSDVSMKFLMNSLSWIVDLQIIGACGAPDGVIRDDAEWEMWRDKHTEYVPGTLVARCILPRRRGGHILLPPGCLVVSNHLSNLDGFCLKASMFPTGSKALMKGDIGKVPIIGWYGKLLDEPFVNFTGNKGGWEIQGKDRLMDRCTEIIQRKFPLIIYPEGVRRKFGRMAPFRLGMIKFAIAQSTPIYPLVIHQSDRAWPLHSLLLNSATVYLSFNDSCLLPRPGDSPELISKLLIQQMVALLRQIPTYNYSVRKKSNDQFGRSNGQSKPSRSIEASKK